MSRRSSVKSSRRSSSVKSVEESSVKSARRSTESVEGTTDRRSSRRSSVVAGSRACEIWRSMAVEPTQTSRVHGHSGGRTADVQLDGADEVKAPRTHRSPPVATDRVWPPIEVKRARRSTESPDQERVRLGSRWPMSLRKLLAYTAVQCGHRPTPVVQCRRTPASRNTPPRRCPVRFGSRWAHALT